MTREALEGKVTRGRVERATRSYTARVTQGLHGTDAGELLGTEGLQRKCSRRVTWDPQVGCMEVRDEVSWEGYTGSRGYRQHRAVYLHT